MDQEAVRREKEIFKITWLGFWVNVLLSAGKLAAGFWGRSSAMVADGVHSLSDMVTDLIVMIFVKISAKPVDKEHDYGHGKFETLATILIGIALFGVAVGIIWHSVEEIIAYFHGEIIKRPELIAVAVALVSIVAKEWVYRRTIKVSEEVNSPALKANAWHHRSDAFSSVGTLIGVGGAYLLGEKWRILDPLAAIVVGLFILKVVFDLVKPNLEDLLEQSLPADMEKDISEIIMSEPIFSDLHNLKTRRLGPDIAVEAHVRVPDEMTVLESHEATVHVERRLKETYGSRTHVMIHVEPMKHYSERTDN